MANQPQQSPQQQPPSGQQQQHATQQLQAALEQHAQAHGLSLPHIDWQLIANAVLLILQAFAQQGGGIAPAAGQRSP